MIAAQVYLSGHPLPEVEMLRDIGSSRIPQPQPSIKCLFLLQQDCWGHNSFPPAHPTAREHTAHVISSPQHALLRGVKLACKLCFFITSFLYSQICGPEPPAANLITLQILKDSSQGSAHYTPKLKFSQASHDDSDGISHSGASLAPSV